MSSNDPADAYVEFEPTGPGPAAPEATGRHRFDSADDLSAPVLEVRDLSVEFHTDDGEVKAVQNVSYTLGQGETLGIVGESGSGKTVTSLAVLGLLPKKARITGEVLFRGRDLLKMGERELQIHPRPADRHGLPGCAGLPQPRVQGGRPDR